MLGLHDCRHEDILPMSTGRDGKMDGDVSVCCVDLNGCVCMDRGHAHVQTDSMDV